MLLLSQWLNRSSSLILEAILCSKGSCWIMWRRIASIELEASLPPTSNLLDVTIQHSNHIYKLQMAPSWYSEYLLFSTGCHHSTSTSLYLPGSYSQLWSVWLSGVQFWEADRYKLTKEGRTEWGDLCQRWLKLARVQRVQRGDCVHPLWEPHVAGVQCFPSASRCPPVQFYLRWEVSLVIYLLQSSGVITKVKTLFTLENISSYERVSD